jgi:4-alpha-glucanotransferase
MAAETRAPAGASRFAAGRHAGAIVPLFSIPSRESWGVGDVADLPRLGRWLSTAGLDFVQLLPVNEMQEGQNSPYSALSAMAIDPIYIHVPGVEDFEALGGEAALSPDEAGRLGEVRRARIVQYGEVRALKTAALRRAFDRFLKIEWRTGSPRAHALRAFIDRESWWLDDYALFRALHDEHEAAHWDDWDPPLRDRDPEAIVEARRRLETDVLRYAYLQWIAASQWTEARRTCAAGLFGDFPFMVSANSADVWARQHEFRYDARAGVPPDAFSETGQDWGLPVYRWDVIKQGGYEWLRQRARRCAELYDGFRVDHLVGFFRTFFREEDGSSRFVPPDEPSQREQGEALLAVFSEPGAYIIAEDLGVVPDFVRASLAASAVPGMKVLRWEREWDAPGRPFRDPAAYPACSVAVSGTHDTETMREWWESASDEERRAVVEIPSIRDAGANETDVYFPQTRDALLSALFQSGSDLVMAPLQDVFGWRDRINTPAVVSDENWCWRLPWPVEALLTEPEAVERARFLRSLVERRSI